MQEIATSIKDAAQGLGLGRTAIYGLINDGRLETVKIGRRRLIKVESLYRLLETNS